MLSTRCQDVLGLAVGTERCHPKGGLPCPSLHTAALLPCPAPNTAVLERAGVDSAESHLNFQLPQLYACYRHHSKGMAQGDRNSACCILRIKGPLEQQIQRRSVNTMLVIMLCAFSKLTRWDLSNAAAVTSSSNSHKSKSIKISI